jgi:hypothetical protein
MYQIQVLMGITSTFWETLHTYRSLASAKNKLSNIVNRRKVVEVIQEVEE